MNLSRLKSSPNFEIIFLIFLTGLVYLPYISRLTYFLDDWYYIYDGVVFGPDIFHAMFGIDRPARGYFFDLYFSLFGPTPFPYHLGAYLWRLFAGICAFRLLSILWPADKQIAFFGSLLFVLYPGYSWWISAIEYQPMIASLALQVFSFLMTLEAIRASKAATKIFFLVAAVVSGWAYIALVEYAIGMEIFRFLCVYLVVSRRQSLPFLKKLSMTIRTWSWNLVIPLGFVIWRLFFFENQRQATDLNLLLANFTAAPANTLWGWFVSVWKSALNAGLYAWFKQFYFQFANTNFEVPGLGVTMLVTAALVLFALWVSSSNHLVTIGQAAVQKNSAKESMLLGLLSLLAAVLPVVLAKRFINLSFYSHYGLPASLASTILLVGAVFYLIPFRRIAYGALSILVVLAATTHSFMGTRTVVLENSMKTFWWQASWRMPHLLPDATLVTLYPYSQVVDNPSGLAYPANLIYFRETQTQVPIRLLVSTLMPTDENVELVLASAGKKSRQYRTHKSVINYSNILVLVQPTPQSCVRVIGGDNVVFSEQDPDSIRELASSSKLENIRIYKDDHTPPVYAFGPEPERDWCYFFEKVDLEVQRGKWQDASTLGDDTLAKGLEPNDVVEWFPFIQAYAMTADHQKLATIAAKTEAYPAFERQVCSVFEDPDPSLQPGLETSELVEQLFCNKTE